LGAKSRQNCAFGLSFEKQLAAVFKVVDRSEALAVDLAIKKIQVANMLGREMEARMPLMGALARGQDWANATPAEVPVRHGIDRSRG
jgi:hypothetical protein